VKFDIISLGDHLRDPHSGQYNESQEERFHMWVELGVRAEALGFDAIWFGEHHCSDYIISSPQLLLAAIASRTSRIRLGTAVSLLPNNDPLRLAEDFATLDMLSRGRAEIGFGSGITEHTFRLFGQDVRDSGALAKENMKLLLALWNHESIDWEGQFRAPIHDSRLEPRTRSGKALPINRATATSVDTAREAGRAGYRLMVMANLNGFAAARPIADAYREEYAKAGHDPANMSVSAPVYMHVRRDGEDARNFWRPYIGSYRTFVKALASSKGATRSLGEALVNPRLADQGFLETDFVGSPDEVAEKALQADRAIGGLDHMLCYFDAGGISKDDCFDSVDLFANEVIPRVNG